MNRIALFGIFALLLVTEVDAQSGVHKCVNKNGRVTYGDSPCPGTGGDSAPQSSAVMNIADMTQGQADLAADCEEVLHNSNQPYWVEKERETSAFNRYCPAFGFKVPLGQETKAFNELHAKKLFTKLRQRFASVPSTTRVYDGGHRSPPTFSGADTVMKQRVSTASKSLVAMIPDLQPGLWKLRHSRGGHITQDESCDDPLAAVRSEIVKSQVYEGLGCVFNGSTTTPRTAMIVLDCPADRTQGGNSVRKGRIEIAIDSPSPQAVTVTLKGKSVEAEIMKSTRIGDCKR